MATVILSALLTVSVLLLSATATTTTTNDDIGLTSARDYPEGDPRRCLEVAKKNGYNVLRFEVLPGFGWDNLRNKDQGQVISYNFSLCRTTDDGRFLLPDSVSAVPIKASTVETFAELIEHWSNWTSTTSKSINIDAGLTLPHVGISGKFSADFEDMKSKQIGDKSVSTRAQVRYIRYAVQMQPDSPLHPVFKGRLLDIAAAHELNETEQARYQSQLLVRDFGTHVTTSAYAGAALVQVDHLRDEWVNSQSEHKSDILASASASLFSVFHMDASYQTKTDDAFMKSYFSQRTSSVVKTMGGPLFKPANFTPDMWSDDVDKDLVAMDRSGDPLYYVITAHALPELPASTLAQVEMSVRDAIELYYAFNVLPGCLDPKAPNFSPAANVDDNSCKNPPSNLTFGGMFQKCDMLPGSNNGDLCGTMRQANPLTGSYSCPANYQAVSLHSDTMETSQSVHSCHSCWLFFHCCDDHYYRSVGRYEVFWCAATGPVPQHTGYMFGGLYTSQILNPVTRSNACPPTFYALNVGAGPGDARTPDLHVCISDDYEQGAEYAVPFAGFISCEAGNPLAVGQVQGKPRLQAYQAGGMSLRSFFSGAAASWPQKCPDGFSKHLATVDRGCQINYCVQTGALSGPALPHVKRPPYMAPPSLPAPPMDNLVIFDPATREWRKNQQARTYMTMLQKALPTSKLDADGSHSSDGSASDSMSPGVAAVISVFVTLACVVVATVVVLAVRSRRQRGRSGYRRLENPASVRANEYGAVRATNVGTGNDAVVAVNEGDDQ